MNNYEALKEMPFSSFSNMVFDVVKACNTQDEFKQFLEKEIPIDLEGTVEEALQKLQHLSE